MERLSHRRVPEGDTVATTSGEGCGNQRGMQTLRENNTDS